MTSSPSIRHTNKNGLGPKYQLPSSPSPLQKKKEKPPGKKKKKKKRRGRKILERKRKGIWKGGGRSRSSPKIKKSCLLCLGLRQFWGG